MSSHVRDLSSPEMCFFVISPSCSSTVGFTSAALYLSYYVQFYVFYNHSHCTLFHDQQSSLLDITASIIQGSATGPATYIVTAGDLSLETLYVNLPMTPI